MTPGIIIIGADIGRFRDRCAVLAAVVNRGALTVLFIDEIQPDLLPEEKIAQVLEVEGKKLAEAMKLKAVNEESEPKSRAPWATVRHYKRRRHRRGKRKK